MVRFVDLIAIFVGAIVWWCKVFLGAQIIDLMMLVVDATKGIQTQTAEVPLICVV